MVKKFFLFKKTANRLAEKKGVSVWSTSSIWRGKDKRRKNKIFVVKY